MTTDDYRPADEPRGPDRRGDAGGAASDTPAGAALPSTAAEPVRVLYVDDEPEYAEVAAEFLEDERGVDAVVPETNPREAVRRLEEERIDCVVSDYDMPGLDGLELLDAVRDEWPELPFILVTGKGDEEIASEAISAGVTNYFRKTLDTDQYGVLAHRISNAVGRVRTERRFRRTQRRYRRLVESSTDVITVLGADGRFAYLSPAAERRLGYPADALVGESVFEYVHPDDRDAAVEQLETLVERPDESLATEFRFERPDGSWMWLEARGRNLLDDPDVEGIIVYARDIDDRKERERALRESERRFRSLFEEAFDGMVIADDGGACVEANPAACELFETSHEEMIGTPLAAFAPEDHDFGAAWRRLRESDVERETFPIVTAEGTERVVELAATPNVAPGRHLSVIRDVTDRERHQERLTALHDSARDFLRAESRGDVAERVVAAATDLLSLSTVAVYLFDAERGTLAPSSASGAVDEGSLDALPPTRGNAVGAAFLDGTPTEVDDATGGVGRDPDGALPDLPLRDGLLFPLGDHGVCVVGDGEAGVTGRERELAEILTATAGTALDRAVAGSELRERTSELRERNRKLERLNRINGIVRELDDALVQADTREEVETAACERLSACNGIAAVWIGRRDSQDRRLAARAWDGSVGVDRYLDAVDLGLDADNSLPAARAATTGEPVHAADVPVDVRRDAWRKAALSEGVRSVFAVPLTYKRISYGTISVHASDPDVLDEFVRTILRDLGNKIANALNAVEHQNAVLTEAGTELKLRVRDENLPLYQVASRADCSLTLETVAPQSEGGVLKYVSVDGAEPGAVADVAEGLTTISDASVVTDDGQAGLVELRFSAKPLTDDLADRGIRVPAFVADADAAILTLLVPDDVDIEWALETLADRQIDPELVAKTERDRTDGTSGQRDVGTYRSKLTPRQQEVARTAYRCGFFESPSECTGEDLADHLDVSPQTVYRHIRTAERKLFETVFAEGVE